MPRFSEEKTMLSILTAILNAFLQAIGWLMPISESGHSAIYHDFAGTANGAVWTVTGVIHIGIAIGIVLASFGIFKKLGVELFNTGKELVHKQLDIKNAKPARSLLYMLIISFVPMLLWLIPIGKYGFLFKVLRSLSYNGTILDEGVCIAFTGILLFLAVRQMNLSRNDKPVTLIPALVIGVACVVLIPTAGMSMTAGIFTILILFGITKNIAYRYCLVMSAPLLLVMGIVEAATAAYKAGIVEIIVGLVLSVAASFICTRLLKFIIAKSYLVYFSYYDFALGGLAVIIGAIQLLVRK